MGLEEKDMDWGLFKEIVNKLGGIREITLTGWGEPLIHPQISEMIKYAKRKGKQLHLTTNGIFDFVRLEEVLLSLDSLTFSIDKLNDTDGFGHDNLKALENLKNLLQLRRKNSFKHPRINIQSVYYGKNEQDIFNLVSWAKKQAVDAVKVIPLNQKYLKEKAFEFNNEKRCKFYRALENFSKKLQMPVDIVNYLAFRGWMRIIYKSVVRIIPRITDLYCLKNLDYLYITVDGQVTPCCELPRYILGDLKKEDLGTIWRGDKLKKFRLEQRVICKGCSFAL